MNTLSKRQFLKLSLASGVALSLSACGGGDDNDIVDVLSDYPEYSLLVEAVKAAGLVETLKGRGPFTVFAPNNAAFGNALTELGLTKTQLFDNKPLLTAVLTYHVLAARVPAADIPFGRAITTVETGIFKIDSAAGGPVITDERNRESKIIRTNLFASNGVIHGIDTVILPGDKDIVDTALARAPEFSTLVAAVQAAGLESTLRGAGPFTVFAPTNAAFASALSTLGIDPTDLLTNPAKRPLLVTILTYHVVPSRVLKTEVPLNTGITTVEGRDFQVNNGLQIVDALGRTANIGPTDVLTSNGVIHVIDNVILPELPPV